MAAGIQRGYVFILLLSCLLLQGCRLTEPVTEVRYPYCTSTRYLIRPNLSYPIHTTVIDDLTPVFSWHYWLDCRPLNYHIQVTENPRCQSGVGASWIDDESSIISDTIGSDLEWSPLDELEPLTLYQWRVAGIINDTMGEYSEPDCFWTGPVCEPESLIAPTLLGLEDGSVIATDFALFAWEYPDPCFPHVLQPELSDNPSFSGDNMMWVLGETEINLYFTSVSMMTLVDCTTYYWRVTARVGSTWGPPSPVWTFSTDFEGTCSEPAPTVTTGPSPTSTSPVIPAPLPTNTPPEPSPADITPPPAPSPISPVGDISCMSPVDLKWKPVNDPSGISEYRVTMEYLNEFNQWKPVVAQAGIQLTELSVNVICGWYYRWNVLAVDGAGNIGPSSGWIEFKLLGQNLGR